MNFWEFNEHNLDDKGRLVLPSSFRGAFSDGGILAFHGQYAAIHTPTEWEATFREIKATGDYSSRELAVIKSYATRFKPDSQSRITLPQRLREATKLEGKEVALIGMGKFIALYSKERWDAIQAETLEGSEGSPTLAEKLAEAL